MLQGGGSSQRALTLSNVAGVFYILISGLGVSLIIGIVEFAYRTHRNVDLRRVTNDLVLISRRD